MADMLVNLLKLPPLEAGLEAARAAGVEVRRARPFESGLVREFVERHFARAWADEISVGYANKPCSVFVAARDRRLAGFAAYEGTARGFFGPTGVDPAFRGKGIGAGLLLASLHGLREMGYAYGIIGGAGPVDFYVKAAGAIPIPDSAPGIYVDMLGPDGEESAR